MRLYCRHVLPIVVVLYAVVAVMVSERIRKKQLTDDFAIDRKHVSARLMAPTRREAHDHNNGVGIEPSASTRSSPKDFPSRTKVHDPVLHSNNETRALNESFSACLLTMDDNHFLIEWMAYHYHTLPLRRLIVAVDPNSMTSPTTIFDRWRKQGMVIDEWSDADYMPPTAIAESKRTFLNFDAMSDETRLHHYRQRIFYTKCLHTLHQENRKWTLFIDSDEYLVLNQRRGQEEDLPTIKEPGSILSYIQGSQNKSACIMVPRLRFGAIQSESGSPEGIPSALNTSAFTTLSFHKHARLDDFGTNKIGKGILDVSQITNETFRVRDPHRLVWEVCPDKLRVPNNESSLIIHHYLGTWEQFHYRNDARKGDVNKGGKLFDEFKNANAGSDDSIHPWLEGFIESIGLETATELLEGVGDIHRWPMKETNREADDSFPNDIVLNRNEPVVADEDAFSACLLTMDDSHFLVEWLAYHYHTLPLRHLIVAIDPHSRTSPLPILNRWRDMGMSIKVMKDDDFMKIRKEDIASMNEEGRSTKLHRKRQRYFMKACLKKFKQEGRKWVLLVDVDEYMTFNLHTKEINDYLHEQNMSTVAAFLQHELARNETIVQRDPCVVMPRLRYGSEESALEQVNKDVPQGFNGSAFQTMRFRKHAGFSSVQHNLYPKTMIDISLVNASDIVVNDPHRPLLKYCPKARGIKVKDSPFVVRHYVGTWEQFSFRDDIRNHDEGRNVSEKFRSYQGIHDGEDDHVRPWLREFVQDVGAETAAKLLAGVGDVHVATRIER